MTLYAPPTPEEIPIGKPALHAFIIGVAHYPHLPGGDGKLAKNPLQLTQVTTPQYTAGAIAEWFATKYHNPQVPLGSVELLISPAKSSPADAKQAVPATDAATMAQIKRSFKAWTDRAGSHRDNIAVFYFCGHGVLKVNHFLLPSDFGDPTEQEAWENCIDFDGMRVGMRACAAQTQLFFVDACRETPPDLLTEIPKGHRLISSNESNDVKAFAVYNAAAEKHQAFGPADGPTYFCEAVLAALRIGAERRDDSSFVVDTFSLGNAIGKVMRAYGRRYKEKLTCNPSPSGEVMDIQHASKASVLAIVGCTSNQANKAAEIVLNNGVTQVHSAVGQAKPLYEIVEAGDWNIDVRFPNGQFPNQILPKQLRPLIFEGVDVP